MRLKRQIDQDIKSHFTKYKQALILLGPRQSGKTTLLKRLFPGATYMLVDNMNTQDALETYSISAYKQFIGNSKTIIIDEIHLISDPGRAVKLIYDQIEDIKIIVTGSSALHIKNKTSESMAGRAFDYRLHPLTWSEYLYQLEIIDKIDSNIIDKILNLNTAITIKLFDQKATLSSILKNGLYPATVQAQYDRDYLKNLADRAIFRDILELGLIENRVKAAKLLKVLAHQIGNLISINEISRKLKMDRQTVERYIEIFEQSYIVFRIYPFSKNERKEIGKAAKIYFYDIGLRNAIIDNFDSIDVRNDAGALFENFIITEVKKLIDYCGKDYRLHYWRLTSGEEVDLILSNNSELIGCEIKLGKGRVSRAFTNRYPEAKTHIVTSANFY